MPWFPQHARRYTDRADSSWKARLRAETVSRELWNGARLPDAISEANAVIASMEERQQVI